MLLAAKRTVNVLAVTLSILLVVSMVGVSVATKDRGAGKEAIAVAKQHEKELQKALTITEEDLINLLSKGRFDKYSKEFLPDSMRVARFAQVKTKPDTMSDEPNADREANAFCSDAVLNHPLKISDDLEYEKLLKDLSKEQTRTGNESTKIIGKILQKYGKLFEVGDTEGEVKIRELIYEQTMRNPVYYNMLVEGLAEKKIGDKTLKELNPWMSKRVSSIEKNFTKDGDGILVDLTWNDDKSKILVTDDYRKQAMKMVMLLDQFVMGENLVRMQSKEHFALSLTESTHARAVKADYTESLPAVLFKITKKNGESYLNFGVNIADGRLEFFSEDAKPVAIVEQKNNPAPQKPWTPPFIQITPKDPEPAKPKEIIKKQDDPEPGKPGDIELKKDPKKDPLYNDKLKHELTGPNDDKGPGKYESTPSVSYPDKKGAPKLSEKQYSSDEVKTNIVEVKPEKKLPIQQQNGKDFYVDEKTGKSEEIVNNDNVEAPKTKQIPVQPKEDNIKNDKIVQGEVSLDSI